MNPFSAKPQQRGGVRSLRPGHATSAATLDKPRLALAVALGGVTTLAMLVGAVTGGCSSSTPGGTGTPDTGGEDNTTPKRDAMADSSSQDSSTTHDAGHGKDGTGENDASDARGGDASDAQSSDANDVDSCTKLRALSDAGGALVTGFDQNDTNGWGLTIDHDVPDADLSGSTMTYVANVGRTCPGSIALTVPFTVYGFQLVEVNYNYGSNPQAYPLWNGFSILHFWVKVAFESSDGGVLQADASAIDFLGLSGEGDYAQWGNYGPNGARGSSDNNPSSVNLFTGSSFSGGEWQEVKLYLSQPPMDGGFVVPTGTSCPTGNACKVAADLQIDGPTFPPVPDGGPAAPTTTVLYVDDVWLEP
jgi:hypothetical protein